MEKCNPNYAAFRLSPDSSKQAQYYRTHIMNFWDGGQKDDS